MTRTNAKSRLNLKQVIAHPYFWSGFKRLHFIAEFSDYLESIDEKSTAIALLEERAKNENILAGKTWERAIDVSLIYEVSYHKKYNFSSVNDLVRVRFLFYYSYKNFLI